MSRSQVTVKSIAVDQVEDSRIIDIYYANLNAFLAELVEAIGISPTFLLETNQWSISESLYASKGKSEFYSQPSLGQSAT